MAKKSYTLLWVAGAVAALSIIRNKLTAYKNLTVTFSGVKFTGFTFPNIQLQIGLTINNNSNTSITAKNIVGQLYTPTGTQQLGTFNVPLTAGQNILVPANSNATVQVNANVDGLSSITSILTSGASVLLKGRITTLGVNIPFEQIIKVG